MEAATDFKIKTKGEFMIKYLDFLLGKIIYAKEGFEVVSEPFLEDGIPHVKMEKIITI